MTAAMIIGTGIFGAVGSATSRAGSGILIAMVLGGLIALATGISAAQLGVNYPKEGGAFTWARELNHKTLGFIAGCAYLGKGIFSLSVISLAFAAYSVQILPTLPLQLFAGIVILAVVVLNFFHVQLTTKVLIGLMVLTVSLLGFSVDGERRRATLQSRNTGSRNMGRISSLGVCLDRISKRTHRRSANRIASRIHDGRGKRTSALAWLSPPEVSHPSKCCSDHWLDSSGISPELRPSKIVGRCQHLHAYLVHYHSFLCLTIAQRAATDDPFVLMGRPTRLPSVGCIFADLGHTHRWCSTCYACRVSSPIVSLPNFLCSVNCWTRCFHSTIV